MCQTPGSKIITYRAYSCRALNESKLKAQIEFICKAEENPSEL